MRGGGYGDCVRGAHTHTHTHTYQASLNRHCVSEPCCLEQSLCIGHGSILMFDRVCACTCEREQKMGHCKMECDKVEGRRLIMKSFFVTNEC